MVPVALHAAVDAGAEVVRIGREVLRGEACGARGAEQRCVLGFADDTKGGEAARLPRAQVGSVGQMPQAQNKAGDERQRKLLL